MLRPAVKLISKSGNHCPFAMQMATVAHFVKRICSAAIQLSSWCSQVMSCGTIPFWSPGEAGQGLASFPAWHSSLIISAWLKVLSLCRVHFVPVRAVFELSPAAVFAWAVMLVFN